MKTAIGIIAYNRPNLLNQVLRALAPQVSDIDTYLFLDAPPNYSKGYLTPDSNKKLVDVCEALFVNLIPHGQVIRHTDNLNIGFNYKYSKDFIFAHYDRGIFFEDDLVPHSYYVQQLLSLMDSLEDDKRVGMVSCYADHNHGLEFQERHRHHYKEMGHQWSFGTWADRYKAISPRLDEYFDLLKTFSSYGTRDDEAIFKLFRTWGNFNRPELTATSQDGAILLASFCEDQIKISSNANHGYYIGFLGEHNTLDQHVDENMHLRMPFHSYEDEMIWDDEIHDHLKLRLLSEVCTDYVWGGRKYLYD